jgi:antitoxin (DNA-binding transcriptional repressor) of toxin-antitoxin stability system
MSTATVQKIGQNFAAWIATVQRGETVAIVDEGREVARLTPPEKKTVPVAAATPLVWPDFAARQRRTFGEGFTLPAGTVDALINEDRGA